MLLQNPPGSDKLPQQLDKTRLEELTNKIRGSSLSRDEEDELVKGHMRLLLSLASKWSSRSPHLVDVFVADGLFAMLTAIRKASTKLREDKTITQYIIVHVLTAFKKAVINQQCVKAPGADRKGDRVQVHNGKEYVKKKANLMRRHGLPKDSSFRTDMYHAGVEECVSKEMVSSVLTRMIIPEDRADLREIFELAPSDACEKAVLELRKHGYNMQEIADQMNTTRAKVSAMLEKIEFRLRELLA